MNEILAWSGQIVFIVFVMLLLSVFIIQPYQVSGESMEPTFGEEGEKVLVFKTPFYFRSGPNYGDIVVIDNRAKRARTLKDEFLETPLLAKIFSINNDHIWIKRVIGLPGDTIAFQDGKIFRNGVLIKEEYIKEEMAHPFETAKVPENCVFVMGDNRNNSSDSRQCGPYPIVNVQGKVVLRYFPLNKLCKF